MPSQDEENRARDDFGSYLARRYPAEQIAWHKGSEPPDHWLHFRGERYAVEVTALRKRYDIGGGAKIPFRAIGRELESFVSRIERRLLDEGYLRGRFAVQIFRAIPNLRAREPELLALIRSAVLELESQSINSKRPFLRAAPRTCSIIKLDGNGSALELWGPTDSMWIADAAIELRALVQERIDVKRRKLRAIDHSKILILDDQYTYSELKMFNTLGLGSEDYLGFHTIYVARANRGSAVLTSQFSLLITDPTN